MNARVALLTLLSACAPPTSGTDTAAPDDTGPTALQDGEQGACIERDGAVVDRKVEPASWVGGAARISWSAPGASRTWVRFTDSLGIDRDLPADDAGGATLRGVTPGSDVDVRVVAEVDGELFCTPVFSAPVSSLPPGLPELQVTTFDRGEISPAFFATSVLTGTGRFAVVLNSLGEIVWAWQPPADVAPQSPLYRVAISLDGESILANVHSAPGDPGAIWRVPWNGVGIEELLLDNIHRDFTELPDGSLAWLAHETRQLEDGTLLRGDKVLERSTTGEITEAWNMWTDYDHGLGPAALQDRIDIPGVQEWAHANGLHHEPDGDDWLLSLPDFGPDGDPLKPRGSLLRVDRQTADLEWELSYSRGDFDIVSGTLAIEAPHSMQVVDGDLLVFNRGGPDSCSRATLVELDEDAGTADVSWQSTSESCVHVVFLGEAMRLPDGDTAVHYSSAGQLDVVGPDGFPKWRVQTDLGAGFGFLSYRSRLHGAEAL